MCSHAADQEAQTLQGREGATQEHLHAETWPAGAVLDARLTLWLESRLASPLHLISGPHCALQLCDAVPLIKFRDLPPSPKAPHNTRLAVARAQGQQPEAEPRAAGPPQAPEVRASLHGVPTRARHLVKTILYRLWLPTYSPACYAHMPAASLTTAKPVGWWKPHHDVRIVDQQCGC